ncbi:thiol reductase thioredoxin [Shewanella sp. OPT22]|nr:thiol reductase thioredoxin [Shewanella sp. OPT22]
MLLGKVTPTALDQKLSEYPDYDGNYQTNPEFITPLKDVNSDTHIAVIIGTWCPDCHRDIPRFMSILNAANNNKISVEYIGVDKEKVDPQAESQAYDFTRLPTYIVMQKGKEVGRITERPETTLEQDLATILSQ